ncbi:ETEC_3214 domain-containing protein [Streptomyces sp. NPDC085900]|uniref:ETEC_3214 domain-containing protein n=1 Tax=Streptomyces sp. NPDC085900 TaxID=3365737 RepID=UPI0037D4271C
MIFVILLFVASVITSVGAVITTAESITQWYNRHYKWQEEEYGRLSTLRAGFLFQKFREQLGQPSYSAPLVKNFRQYTFQRRGYWVDAITNPGETVVAYAVTSCRSDFNPTFTYPAGGAHSRKMVLNKSTLSEILSGNSNVQKMRIAPAVATNRAYVFIVLAGGNPTKYRQFAAGMNDTCKWHSKGSKIPMVDAWAQWALENPKPPGANTETFDISALDRSARVLAAQSIPNTYAETAPFVDILALYPDQIGVDRIAVR